MIHQVLIVDDEPLITEMLKDVLSAEPYKILSAESAEEALKLLSAVRVDVVISDEKMPGMSGSEFLGVVRKKYPETIRMILTGHASLEGAIRSINEGKIYRFFTKPCNIYDLAVTIRQALQQKELMSRARRLVQTVKSQGAVLKRLEEQFPGLTSVRKDETGEVILDELSLHSEHDSFMEEIDRVLKECRGFSASGP